MTLTIKPKNFFMKARLRDPHFVEHAGIVRGDAVESKSSDKQARRQSKGDDDKSKPLPMKILYGSNTGTCEALAQSLASSAPEYGFEATVSSLDDGVSALSKDVPVVIFTASYEGLPPDNAGHFVEWISSNKRSGLEGVAFAVFGVGNSESTACHPVESELIHVLQRSGFIPTRKSPRWWTKRWQRMEASVSSIARRLTCKVTKYSTSSTTGKRTNSGRR
jgi:sulfite reductase alpha subunit-like flavoprotein